jgi:hypothetical protein
MGRREIIIISGGQGRLLGESLTGSREGRGIRGSCNGLGGATGLDDGHD